MARHLSDVCLTYFNKLLSPASSLHWVLTPSCPLSYSRLRHNGVTFHAQRKRLRVREV